VTRQRLATTALSVVLGMCVTTSFVLAPSSAKADQAAAQESFKVATEAYGKGEFRDAAVAFEKAYRDAPHGSPMYNAGLAWEAAKEPAHAADAYQLALATPGLTPQQTTDAKARLASLEKTLGRLEVNGPPGTTVTVAHVTAANVPVRLHIAAGQQDMVVKFADGQESRQQIGVPAGVIVPVTVVSPAPLPPPAPVTPPPAPPPPEPPSSSGSTAKTLGWVAIGGSAAVLSVSIYMGVSALDSRDEFEATQRRSVDAHDRADSQRTWTNVLLVGAVALAATGVVLILTAPKGTPDASKTTAPAHALRPGLGSLSLTF
jgi:hypothetical protein